MRRSSPTRRDVRISERLPRGGAHGAGMSDDDACAAARGARPELDRSRQTKHRVAWSRVQRGAAGADARARRACRSGRARFASRSTSCAHSHWSPDARRDARSVACGPGSNRRTTRRATFRFRIFRSACSGGAERPSRARVGVAIGDQIVDRRGVRDARGLLDVDAAIAEQCARAER